VQLDRVIEIASVAKRLPKRQHRARSSAGTSKPQESKKRKSSRWR
jgi:hypothetical protein